MRRRSFRGGISESRAWGNLVKFVHSLAPRKGLEVVSAVPGQKALRAHSNKNNISDRSPQPRSSQHINQYRSSTSSSPPSSSSSPTMASGLPTGNLTGAGKFTLSRPASSIRLASNIGCHVSAPNHVLTSTPCISKIGGGHWPIGQADCGS